MNEAGTLLLGERGGEVHGGRGSADPNPYLTRLRHRDGATLVRPDLLVARVPLSALSRESC